MLCVSIWHVKDVFIEAGVKLIDIVQVKNVSGKYILTI